jgi:hypothetical protein
VKVKILVNNEKWEQGKKKESIQDRKEEKYMG